MTGDHFVNSASVDRLQMSDWRHGKWQTRRRIRLFMLLSLC